MPESIITSLSIVRKTAAEFTSENAVLGRGQVASPPTKVVGQHAGPEQHD